MGYCIEMVFTFKKLNFKNSKKFKKIQNRIFFQKFISRKLLVLERSGLHHRVENIEKFLPYKFHRRAQCLPTEKRFNFAVTVIDPGFHSPEYLPFMDLALHIYSNCKILKKRPRMAFFGKKSFKRHVVAQKPS